MTDRVFEIFGQLVLAGGGGGLIAYLLTQWLGKKWIENKFAERLEQLKHDQNVVVARLKVEVDSMLSGALKFQERDFTVLPGVWEKLYQATVHIDWLISPIREIADVASMKDSVFIDWVETLEFSAMHKGALLRTTQPEERQKHYEGINYIYQMAKVRKIFGDYQRYVQEHAIFFPLDLKAKLMAIEEALWQQICDRGALEEGKVWGGAVQDLGAAFEKVIPPLRDEIELLIRSRLESHMKAFSEKVSS
ncbi:hypothetical protein [Variovorax rhizosphaerae]|uniref:Uncharacterized protein n=1 Tax=Variovorax rhizosphaerae TaxID=1836200 RepID=A0ABU8WUH5_9BURK